MQRGEEVGHGGGPASRVTATVRGVVRRIAGAPVGWPGVFACLTAVVVVRTVLELLLGPQHTLLYHGGTYLDVLTYANAYVSWLCTLLLLGLVVHRFLPLGLLATGRLVASLLLVCWVVPPLNLWGSRGRGAEIYYGTGGHNLLHNLFHLFDPTVSIPMAPLGVRVEILLVMIGCVVGAPLAFRVRVRRGAALALAVYLSIFALGYLPAIYRGLGAALPAAWRWSPETPEDFFVMYLPVLLALAAWFVAEARAEGAMEAGWVAWLLYPSRLGFYLYLAAFGFVHASSVGGPLAAALEPRPLLRLASLLFCLALLFAWARIENDARDRRIDEISNRHRPIAAGRLDPDVARGNGRVLLALSLLLVIPCGPSALPAWGLIAALCHVYSSPPLRLRRFHPAGHLVLAGIGVSTYVLGAAAAQGATADPGAAAAGGSGLYRYLADSAPLLPLFVAFFLLSHLKDLKDVEGDAAGGVRNVFAAPRRRRAVALLCLLGFGVAVAFVLRAVGLWDPWPLALLAVAVAGGTAWLARLDDLRRAERLFLWVQILGAVLSILWLHRQLG